MKKPLLIILLAAGWLAQAVEALAADAAPAGAVKVFILAGQSNMEGKAPNALFDHQATNAATREQFAHLRRDGQWVVRDDVFIKFLERHGPLTVGYGSPGRTGSELEFGTVMGDRLAEPVVLIKAAWGGHSLAKQFRPPSAGWPADELLQKELKQAQDRVTKNNEKNRKNDPLPTLDDIRKPYGSSYRAMLAEVRRVTTNLGKWFPTLAGRRTELAGFAWFQGWNDQYGTEHEYESNLRHFIKDVRRDLDAPGLPFVIAAMGQNGSKPAKGAMLVIQQAQLAMNDVPEFKGNVKTIRTDVLVDKAAEDLYPTWQKNQEQWKLTGGDHPYHYLGSAIWFNRIGRALGEAMAGLMGLPAGQAAGVSPNRADVRPVRVLVWDEQQPEQKRAYGEKFLGETIASHLSSQPGFTVRTAALSSPGQGLDDAALDNADVVIWWSHQKNALVADEAVERLVKRVRAGQVGFLALHSAHWSKPFVRLMQERAKDDALAQIPAAERATASFEYANESPYGRVPKRDAPLTPSLRKNEATGTWQLTLPGCIFPAYRGDGAPSHVTTLLPHHPIAAGLPAKWDVSQTEMYDEPFHVPAPDEVVFEERWDKGEHFRSGCAWRVGRGRVFYFRPGHETYPVFKQAEPLRAVANAARWLAPTQAPHEGEIR